MTLGKLTEAFGAVKVPKDATLLRCHTGAPSGVPSAWASAWPLHGLCMACAWVRYGSVHAHAATPDAGDTDADRGPGRPSRRFDSTAAWNSIHSGYNGRHENGYLLRVHRVPMRQIPSPGYAGGRPANEYGHVISPC